MSLPPWEYLAPEGLDQALEQKTAWGQGAVWLAGGTDLLVRGGQGLAPAQAVISLKNLTSELSSIKEEAGKLSMGALAVLHDAGANESVRKNFPGLVAALASIGAETCQQRVGTIGGNLCLEPRCLYYNQTEFWRSGVAPCFKLGGEVCHPGGAAADRCRSVCSADGAVMLMALGARVKIANAKGEREAPLTEFFTGKGEQPLDLAPEDLLVEIILDIPQGQAGSAYEKLRARGAIDFPLLSAGAYVELEGGKVSNVRLALGAVYAAPLIMKDAVAPLIGARLTDEAITQAAKRAGSHTQPFLIENMSAPAAWRGEMVPVLARRALIKARSLAEASNE